MPEIREKIDLLKRTEKAFAAVAEAEAAEKAAEAEAVAARKTERKAAREAARKALLYDEARETADLAREAAYVALESLVESRIEG